MDIVLRKELNGKKVGEKVSNLTVKCAEDLIAQGYAEPVLNFEEKDTQELVEKTVQKAMEEVKPETKVRHDEVGVSRAYKGIFGKGRAASQAAYDFGAFILAKAGRSEETRAKFAQKLADRGIETKTFDGAFLVPTNTLPYVANLYEKFGVVRANGMVLPIGSGKNIVPQVTGDLTVEYPDAGAAPTGSEVTGSSVVLDAFKYQTYSEVPNETFADAVVNVGEVYATRIIKAMTKAEDLNAFYGDYTSTYANAKGINYVLSNSALSGNCIVTLTGSTWAAADIGTFQTAAGKLSAFADDDEAAWYCHKNFYYTIMFKLAMALGGANATEATMSVIGRNPMFMGRRVVFTQVMPSATASSKMSCVLGNLKQGVVLGDRQSLTIETSREAAFAKNALAIRAVERVALAVVNPIADAYPLIAIKTA